MKRLIFLSLLVVLMIFTSVAFAQVQNDFIPTMINYQGFLTNQNGQALNGLSDITFALYSDSTGVASVVWEETHTGIDVENGLFNVLLGAIDSLTAADLTGERYLGIRVVGESEMTPRMRLASTAYSLQAENANMLDNIDSKDFFLPLGFIGMWYGAIDSIPAGWALCDGGTYDRSDGQGTIQTPNLTDRFIVAAGQTYGIGATGGENTHVLSTAELPAHDHSNGVYNRLLRNPVGNVTTDGADYSASEPDIIHWGTLQSVGNNASHENRPPYFALAFIMKL